MSDRPHPGPTRTVLRIRAVPGLPDLSPADDLVDLVLAATSDPLLPGDVLTVSSKAVAKLEGGTLRAERDDVVEAETDRDVARRGDLRVVRTRHGLVLAAAGVDASNTAAGTVVPLPVDPDASARRMRTQLCDRAGVNVAVVVTDTAGRAWRTGQTDIAIGCAGMLPAFDLSGSDDAYGHPLLVTTPAVADEIAGAAALVLDKAGRTPVAVVSGVAEMVLPTGEHGPGAAALVRPEAEDLFGLGTQLAALAAVRRAAADARGFPVARDDVTDADAAASWVAVAGRTGSPVTATADADGPVVRVVCRARGPAAPGDSAVLLAAGALGERLRVLAWADGYLLVDEPPAPAAVGVWSVHRRTSTANP